MTPNSAVCECPLCASAVPTPEGFIALLGGFPQRAPLDVRLLEEQSSDGYTRRTIDYAAEGGTRVPAYLLVPHDHARISANGRLPGVLAIHQDGDRVVHDIGKDEPAGLRGDADQRYGVELAARGYVVLIPDRGGHGARYRPPSELPREFRGFRISLKDGRELTRHLYGSFMAQRDMFAGRMPWRWGLFEMHRAIDCLAALPEVDARRDWPLRRRPARRAAHVHRPARESGRVVVRHVPVPPHLGTERRPAADQRVRRRVHPVDGPLG